MFPGDLFLPGLPGGLSALSSLRGLHAFVHSVGQSLPQSITISASGLSLVAQIPTVGVEREKSLGL